MTYDNKEPKLNEKYGIYRCISFNVPDAWYEIVDECLAELSKLLEWNPDLVAQVKQKWYELRIYLDGDLGHSKEAQAIVRKAEAKANEVEP